MSYKKETTALTFRDAKTAAIFSDYVIPIELHETFPAKSDSSISHQEILRKILPESLLDSKTNIGLDQRVTKYIAHYCCTFPFVLSGIKELPNGETFEQRIEKGLPEMMRVFSVMLSETNTVFDEVVGLNRGESKNDADGNICLSLTGLKAIDVEHVSWDQIIEFREDDESKRKLRNLKLYLHENYDGKSRDFIEDSISKKVEDYEKVLESWGMKTFQATLNTILSSKSVISLAAFGITSGLGAGIPIAAAVGSSFTVGSMALEVCKRKNEKQEFISNDPISYIIDVKDKLR